MRFKPQVGPAGVALIVGAKGKRLDRKPVWREPKDVTVFGLAPQHLLALPSQAPQARRTSKPLGSPMTTPGVPTARSAVGRHHYCVLPQPLPVG